MTCHNLCSTLKPPPLYKSLLGLGLNFCVQPHFSSGKRQFKDTSDRFRRDFYTKVTFTDTGSEFTTGQLFIRSDWHPPKSAIPPDIRARVSHFLQTLRPSFKRRSVPSNLTKLQRRLLTTLRNSDEFIVLPADKNLGPCILERRIYTKRVLSDHLSDQETYSQLNKEEALARIKAVKQLIVDFVADHSDTISNLDRKFLKRSLDVPDPLAYFYITAKVHKKPWTTRPIVSHSGSITQGIGRWLSQQLQPICMALPSYLKSSFDLRQKLLQLKLPQETQLRLFTADATSMYTNIDTTHALPLISEFIHNSPRCSGIQSADAIIKALEIVMHHNIFCFNDTYWIQKTGTAMGTPPAPDYATLYFGLHELDLLPRFQNQVLFYKRYIDDVFGIWCCHEDSDTDQNLWTNFKASMNCFGKLEWEFSERSLSTNFLDLTITLDQESQKFTTCLYEKPSNLYLYIPPHSAHPPGMIRGLIHGTVLRIVSLTSHTKDIATSIRSFLHRLYTRGYDPETIHPITQQAIRLALTKKRHKTLQTRDPVKEEHKARCRVFLHLEFNPHDPSRRYLQHVFRQTMLKPKNEPPLPDMLHYDINGRPIGIDRMVVAYHRAHNLKNLLFPRRFREAPGFPASVAACTNQAAG